MNAAGTAITGVVIPSGAATGYLTVTTPVGTSNGLFFVISPTPPAWQTALSVGAAVTGGSTGTTVEAMTTDASGNVYLAGRLYGSGRFGTITLSSVGAADAFIAKWSPTANRFLWAVRGGGIYDDIATAIAVSGNSVYVTGHLESPTATFGSTTLTNAGYTDVFIAKLTDAGSSATFSWVKQGASSGYDQPTGMAVSGSSVYVVGQSNNALTVGGMAASSTGGGGGDIFITKLTDAGSTSSVAWVLVAGGPYGDYVHGIAANGNQLYITGRYNGNTQLGSWSLPNASNQTYISDTFVAKLVDAGSTASFAWAQRGGGPDNDGGYAIAVEGTTLYITGSYAGPATSNTTALPNAGQDDAYIAKLTDTGTSGSFVWAKTMGGSFQDRAMAIAAHSGAVYAAGTYSSYVAFFGSSILANAYTSRGGYSNDIFVTKLIDAGPTASFAWAQRAGGLSHDEAFALALAGNTIYVAGRAVGPAAFPPLSFPSATNQDGAYLASMTETLVTATASPTKAEVFLLYPNPTHGHVELALPAAWARQSGRVSVLNTLGQLVKQQPFSNQAAGSPLLLELADLPTGLYLMRIQFGNQSFIQRLVLR